MKRRLLKIAVLLVLGAIVNVAVAQLFILTKTGLPPGGAMREGAERSWPSGLPSDWPPLNSHRYFDGLAWSWEQWSRQSGTPGRPSELLGLRIYSAGFPLRSLQREVVFEFRAEDGYGVQRSRSRWRDGVYVRALDWRLAVMPAWPGFAINTVLYGAILWLLFFAPFELRRWRRIKRGLCPACAYPVGESDLCTECGNRVRKTSP